MSIRQNGNVIAGSFGVNMPLLHAIWSDHVLNDISWLRADTFSWQSGDLYVAVYEHLVDDWNNGTRKTETVGGHTFEYILAPDGHKLFSNNGHELVYDLYNEIGIAWYYILDQTNKRFKLPRTKFGFTGMRDYVGGYVEAGLPDHSHHIATYDAAGISNGGGYVPATSTVIGSVVVNNGTNGNGTNGEWTDRASTTYSTSRQQMSNASLGNSTYGKTSTVQPRATQMYLYFYVGNQDQNQYKLDTGKLTELANYFDITRTSEIIEETKNNAITEVTNTKNTATANIKSTQQTTESEINTLKTNTINQITATKNSAATEIENAKNQAIEDVGNVYPTVTNYPNTITNCITTIPQDISFTLSDGVLKINSGSKTYRPNGVGVFDTVLIDKDITVSVPTSTADGKAVLFLRTDKTVWVDNFDNITSGETAPAGGTFYNTTENTIDWYNGSGKNVKTYSLPLCLCTVASGVITSVDRVYNGFGFIGSTVYALPGIEYLIPNGRTVEGRLYNWSVKTTKVTIATAKYANNLTLSLNQSGNIYIDYAPNTANKIYYVPTQNEMHLLDYVNGWNKCYVEEDNMWYENNKTTTWTQAKAIPIGRAKAEVDTFKITYFETDTALKHDDDSELVHKHKNESITGIKTFEPTQADGRLVFQLNDITIGTKPSVNHFGGFKCIDSQGKEFGNCNSSYNTAGRIGTNFYVQKEIDGTTKSASLGVYIDEDGTAYAQAPTTGTSDNTNHIATTKFVHDVFNAIYPVGSVYIGTQASCPMTIAIPGSTWALVSSGRALWTGTGSNGNSTIEAGLPNITGNIGNLCTSVTSSGATPAAPTGAFSATRTAVGSAGNEPGAGRWIGYLDGTNINASRSSSIYGASTTVQPPAYVVNVWRRTA